eukprot:gene8960-6286_t
MKNTRTINGYIYIYIIPLRYMQRMTTFLVCFDRHKRSGEINERESIWEEHNGGKAKNRATDIKNETVPLFSAASFSFSLPFSLFSFLFFPCLLMEVPLFPLVPPSLPHPPTYFFVYLHTTHEPTSFSLTAFSSPPAASAVIPFQGGGGDSVGCERKKQSS